MDIYELKGILRELVAEMERAVPYAAALAMETLGERVVVMTRESRVEPLDPSRGVVFTVSTGRELIEYSTGDLTADSLRRAARELVKSAEFAGIGGDVSIDSTRVYFPYGSAWNQHRRVTLTRLPSLAWVPIRVGFFRQYLISPQQVSPSLESTPPFVPGFFSPRQLLWGGYQQHGPPGRRRSPSWRSPDKCTARNVTRTPCLRIARSNY